MVSNILYKYCITAQNVSYLHENISIHSFIHKAKEAMMINDDGVLL